MAGVLSIVVGKSSITNGEEKTPLDDLLSRGQRLYKLMASSLQGCSLAPLSETKGKDPGHFHHVIGTLKRIKNMVSARKRCSNSQVRVNEPKFRAYQGEEKKKWANGMKHCQRSRCGRGAC